VNPRPRTTNTTLRRLTNPLLVPRTPRLPRGWTSRGATGTFSDDGKTIPGAWEVCHDGATWEHDFDLTYTKIE
jgi:hypothetical protein